MHASDVTAEVVARANELYWHSDASVNQIAEELELSKGALYGALEPQPSGLGCPLCGDEVGYPNRTARERGSLDCPTCDWDGSRDETIAYDVSAEEADETRRRERTPPTASVPTDVAPRPAGAVASTPAEGDRTPSRPIILPPLGIVAKGALIGGAVGLALVLLARRR